MVVKTIFSSLGTKSLFAVRTVCREWWTLGTEELLTRASTGKALCMCDNEHDELHSVRSFVSVMESSTKIPIVRFSLRLNLQSFSAQALYRFLTFIAQVVQELDLQIGACTQPDQKAMPTKNVIELDSRMKSSWDDGLLQMPALELLRAAVLFRGNFGAIPPFFGVALMALIKKLLKGASNLKTFSTDFDLSSSSEPRKELDERPLYASLPGSVRRLDFLGQYKASAPYGALTIALEELNEIGIRRDDWAGSLECLLVHSGTLRKLHLNSIDGLYRVSYPSFPTLHFVAKLYTIVSWNTNFDFVTALPNLRELTLKIEGVATPESDPEKGLSDLTPHPSVRRLTVGSARGFTGREMIRFSRLSACFPNVTHLTFHSPERLMWINLSDLFQFFPNVLWLYLPFAFIVQRGLEDGLEALLTGIRLHVCKALSRLEDLDEELDDEMIEEMIEGENCNAGMDSLKRLKVLELHATSEQYAWLFTNLTFLRVFMKLESLAEIRFLFEESVPEAVRPFQERLREKGIELLAMKEDGLCGLEPFL